MNDLLSELCSLTQEIQKSISDLDDSERIEIEAGLDTLAGLEDGRDEVAKCIMALSIVHSGGVSVEKSSNKWPTLNNFLAISKACAGIGVVAARPVEGKLWPSLQMVG